MLFLWRCATPTESAGRRWASLLPFVISANGPTYLSQCHWFTRSGAGSRGRRFGFQKCSRGGVWQIGGFFFSRVVFHTVCLPCGPGGRRCSLSPPPAFSLGRILSCPASLRMHCYCSPRWKTASRTGIYISLSGQRVGRTIQFPRSWLQRRLHSQCPHDKSHFISFVVVLYSSPIISFFYRCFFNLSVPIFAPWEPQVQLQNDC